MLVTYLEIQQHAFRISSEVYDVGACNEMQIPFLCKIVPRQQKAAKAVQIIRDTVEKLVAQCKEMVEAEKETLEGEEYVNEGDPSVLRFLLASREEVLITAPKTNRSCI